jgi:hypothetical protein
MWIFVLIGILLFYAVLGAAYELINCYLHPSPDEDEYDESNYDIEYNRRQQQQEQQENKVLTRKDYIICGLLGFVGFLLQPLYLMFYVIYALMQCYRRMPCWAIYAMAY